MRYLNGTLGLASSVRGDWSGEPVVAAAVVCGHAEEHGGAPARCEDRERVGDREPAELLGGVDRALLRGVSAVLHCGMAAVVSGATAAPVNERDVAGSGAFLHCVRRDGTGRRMGSGHLRARWS